MAHRSIYLINDLSPRARELTLARRRVAWGRNSLDRKRAPFTSEEIEIARQIGTPTDNSTDKNEAD